MAIIVYHSGYGCDTGCCGHRIEDEESGREDFFFDHPYSTDDHLEWAKKLVRDNWGEEHVADLDWDNCFVVDD